MMTIQQLRKLRIKLGVAQEDISKTLGFNHSYIGQLELCRKNPTPELLEQYEALLRDCENGKLTFKHRRLFNGFAHSVEYRELKIASKEQVRSLREKRLALNISISEMAKWLGYEYNTWRSKEKGYNPMLLSEYKQAVQCLQDFVQIDIDREKIVQDIHDTRIFLGLPYYKFAPLLGVAATTIKRWENGFWNTALKLHEVARKLELLKKNIQNVPSLVVGKAYRFSNNSKLNNRDNFINASGGIHWDSGFIFIYQGKQGIHHCFKEKCGGWSRTYTDAQLIGKKISEVQE